MYQLFRSFIHTTTQSQGEQSLSHLKHQSTVSYKNNIDKSRQKEKFLACTLSHDRLLIMRDDFQNCLY